MTMNNTRDADREGFASFIESKNYEGEQVALMLNTWQASAAHERARLRPLLEGVREALGKVQNFVGQDHDDLVQQTLAALNAELGE